MITVNLNDCMSDCMDMKVVSLINKVTLKTNLLPTVNVDQYSELYICFQILTGTTSTLDV